MALYHLSVKTISRKKGCSAVEAASYRSGEKLYDKLYGKLHDYTRKRGIFYTHIFLPSDSPPAFYNREILWNAVEAAEKRCDARIAREVEIALPNELTWDERIGLVRNFIIENFVSQGMCADVAFHTGRQYQKEDSPNNPHAHILLTTRPIDQNGFSNKKNRDWDKREYINLWRENWAKAQNMEFERKGLEVRVSHESYIAQGINRIPTKHLGHRAKALERRGIYTDRSNKNREIIARNKELEEQHKLRKNRLLARTVELSR